MKKNHKLLLGAHTSAAGGVQNALYEGLAIGATTVQLFTTNQKRWDSKPVTDETEAAWNQALSETGLNSIMSHDSYLINLGSAKPENLEKSKDAFRSELERCQKLGIAYLNFHPGAYVGGSLEACIDRIVESLLELEPLAKAGKTRLLIEATAGQGSQVGACFEELGEIVRRVEKTIPIGICIDTCHIFVAGYDIRTPDAWGKTLSLFNEQVGMQHLYAFHINDSVKPFGSRVDRHAPLGEGEIGWEAFRFIVNDPRLKSLPMYLETPGGPVRWKEEIQKLKDMSID
jgi:deoxyribonuclease IV